MHVVGVGLDVKLAAGAGICQEGVLRNNGYPSLRPCSGVLLKWVACAGSSAKYQANMCRPTRGECEEYLRLLKQAIEEEIGLHSKSSIQLK